MKKITSLLLFVCFFICICSCNKEGNENVQNNSIFDSSISNDQSSNIIESCEDFYDENSSTIVSSYDDKSDNYFSNDIIVSEDITSEASENSSSAEKRLSNNCDKILASGYDSERNYYELVADEKEDYSGTNIKIGAIKNNKWIIELTEKSPFIQDDGLLIGNYSIYDDIYKFGYIGNGCFTFYHVIMNVNTGKFFSYKDAPGNLEFVLYSMGYNSDLKYRANRFVVNNEGLVLMYDPFDENVGMLNTTDMEITNIKMKIDYGSSIYPYSEGLFAIEGSYGISGFYNIKGKKIIDLSQYKLFNSTVYPAPDILVFVNGKCKFRIINDQETIYEITIDKTGKVINSILSDQWSDPE